MDDMSQIGRAGTSGSAASRARRGIPHCSSVLLPAEKGEYFWARGSAQPLENARFGQGSPRKTGRFSLIVFGRAWPGLAQFGFGLDSAWIRLGLWEGSPKRPTPPPSRSALRKNPRGEARREIAPRLAA